MRVEGGDIQAGLQTTWFVNLNDFVKGQAFCHAQTKEAGYFLASLDWPPKVTARGFDDGDDIRAYLVITIWLCYLLCEVDIVISSMQVKKLVPSDIVSKGLSQGSNPSLSASPAHLAFPTPKYCSLTFLLTYKRHLNNNLICSEQVLKRKLSAVFGYKHPALPRDQCADFSQP